ncbi:MAG: hypothetical protein COC01_07690 [Bacteroidetes bacterium]|nr:MAG: hypothetical protein COC01_07690 [Bacteroidota bacterium]
MNKSPFKFLDSYTKEDKDIFFGRDKEIEELYSKVFESKILLVYGISGTGKSSLINCGLANKFEESDWLPVHVRRGSNMLQSVSETVSNLAITPLKPNSSLHESIKSLYLDHFKPIYLIFDQFEELFIFGNKFEKEEFSKEIKEVVESDLQCKLLFVMREEYLAGITEFERVIPTFLENRIRIEKMARSNAKDAIEGPCKVHDIVVEDGFADALLDKLSPDNTEVELTYLQVFLDKIFKTTTSKNPDKLEFNNSILDQLGDVSDLLGNFLEEQINELDDPDSGLVMLKSFVSVKGTKRQITEEEVADFSKTLGKNVDEETINEYIQKFVTLRILRDKDTSGRYELRHDSLAEKIYEKITIVEKELLEIGNFIENAFSNYEKRNILLNERDLKYIDAFQGKLFLNNRLKIFIKKSQDVIYNRKRALKRVTYLAVSMFLTMLFGVGYFGIKKMYDTTASDLAIEALFLNDRDPAASLDKAIAAYDIEPTDITKKAIFEAFFALSDKFQKDTSQSTNPIKSIFDFTPCDAQILSAKYSTDGTLIYGHLADTSIKIWSNKGKELITLVGNQSPVIAVNISPDNQFIASIDEDHMAYVWKTSGAIICSIKVQFDPINTNNIVGFSPDGKYFTFLQDNNAVLITDNSGKKIQLLQGHTAPVTSATFSNFFNRHSQLTRTIAKGYNADLSNMIYLLATSSKDSSAIIWYYNHNESAFQEYIRCEDHEGVVWSAKFPASGKYLLTTCDDAIFRIFDLNGKLHIERQGVSKHLVRREYFQRPICNAQFAMNEKAIILTTYSTSTKDHEKGIRFSQRFAFTGMYTKRKLIVFSWGWDSDTLFSFVDLSPNENYAVLTVFGDDVTILLTDNGFSIKTFHGIQPHFSRDGNYLLCIDGNKLNLFVANEKEIFRLVNEEKIFDNLSSSKYYYDDWYLF